MSAARSRKRRVWLLPIAAMYGAAIRLRNARYDRIPRASHAAPIPLISVGNLTTGGTGKTPFVILLVQRLIALGRRPAVLTRGYRGSAESPADEVLELRNALPQTPVIVDADRVRSAAAVARDGADCAVLDDGFQHRRLRRDLDIVLIDALDPWGGDALLPAGRLREPTASLQRAHLIVLTRANLPELDAVARLREHVRQLAPQAPILDAAVDIERIVDAGGSSLSPDSLRPSRVVPVCAIGNPDAFAATVRSIAALVADGIRFRDHHRYRPADISRILDAAGRCRADAVVTTRKDWVKLRPLWPADAGRHPPLLRLDMRMTLNDPDDRLMPLLRRALEARRNG
jgi:tetraacyldisaccharide 4'-kinase